MKYKELIQFESLDSVVQLIDANEAERAKILASSYIISEDMAQRINQLITGNLQFSVPQDNKALLIVGNYGSGKSHLMSVISSIAEDKSLLDLPNLSLIQDSAQSIAGQFEVIRIEIGASEKALRRIITDELTKKLGAKGVEFHFPSADSITNNKAAFEDMMGEFGKKFPDKGLLFVVDEMLDYLRKRDDRDIIDDLNFLREIGEVCRDLRFRFIAGVQEAIFDSQRFQPVADSVRRVQDRFQQVSIIREDVKFVIAERLLKKDTAQKAKIREYLEPFSKYYGTMADKMDEFVNLFPVHPDYIDTFEMMSIIEKREALRTLSLAMQEILDTDIPKNYPGLIAFDSYWDRIKDNASFRTTDEIKQVMKCSNILESRIRNSLTRKQYTDMALRLVHALSIHRLTVGDIYSAVGISAEELRDRLCLYDKTIEDIGGEPDDDLLTLVHTVLREIHRTVSGQFISFNTENNHYHLDLKKTQDYDAKIESRAASLSPDQLNTAYYEVLKHSMEKQDVSAYVAGYKIWQHELTWQERQVARAGYLFFGSPNDRSTAVPERDFYIYFIQPYEPPRFSDDKKAEEVFFRLDTDDEIFQTALKNYAAAFELAGTSSAATKQAYKDKMEEFRLQLAKWLRENMLTAYSVTHGGKKYTMTGSMQGRSPRDLSGESSDDIANFRDIIDTISGVYLAISFEDQAPKYPKFSVKITSQNFNQVVTDALKGIGSPQHRTKQATAVLDALELLDGDKLDPTRSFYSRFILNKLKNKASGQVLNRSEIIENIRGIEYMNDGESRLEPEWVAIIIAALVYSGDIILAITGDKLDAAKLDRLLSLSPDDLKNFKHLEVPKDWNKPGLAALCQLLGMADGCANALMLGNKDMLKQLLVKAQESTSKIAKIQSTLNQNLNFWGKNILSTEKTEQYQKSLQALKEFLESIDNYNMPNQLKNFRYTADEIKSYEKPLKELGNLESLHDFVNKHADMGRWLSLAQEALPRENELADRIEMTKERIISNIDDTSLGNITESSHAIDSELQQLKKDYITTYTGLHVKARLSSRDDEKKVKLTKDPRLQALRRLADIDLMPRGQLHDIWDIFDSLKSCSDFSEADLSSAPICPHCGYRPIHEDSGTTAATKLQIIDESLDKTLSDWQASLLNNLQDPTVDISLLKPEQKSAVDSFISTGKLPDVLSDELISGLAAALKGLQKIEIKTSTLYNKLHDNDVAVSIDDIKNRFNDYIDEVVKGKEKDKVRIIIKQDKD